MISASASDIKNAFGKYLDLALINGEVEIIRYGRVVAKIVAINNKDSEDNSPNK